MSVDRYFFPRGGPVIPSRGLFQVEPAPAVPLEHYRGDGPAEVAYSDLKQDRSRARAPMRLPLRYRRRGFRAKATYTLRLLAHILPDAEARWQKRRAIAFETDR